MDRGPRSASFCIIHVLHVSLELRSIAVGGIQLSKTRHVGGVGLFEKTKLARKGIYRREKERSSVMEGEGFGDDVLGSKIGRAHV